MRNESESLPAFTESLDGHRMILNFEYGLWIAGRVIEEGFAIDDMYYGDDTKRTRKQFSRKGFGTKALNAIREKYGTLFVCSVTDEAEGFWVKMVERGIVKEIVSYWD